MRRALAALLLSACAGDGEPRPATAAYIVPAIFVPSCATASCHSELAEAGNLVLEGDALVITMTLEQKTLVHPGRPELSQLVHLLRGEFTDLRMPPDLPLAEVDIVLIERWIADDTP